MSSAAKQSEAVETLTVADVAPFFDELIQTGASSPKVHVTEACSRIHTTTPRPKDPAVLFADAPICGWCVRELLPDDVKRAIQRGGESS